LPGLTSALHVDLKLWQPLRPLGGVYVVNNIIGNALKAARSARNPLHPDIGQLIGYDRIFFGNQGKNIIPPKPSDNCAILDYDRWLLTNIRDIRQRAVALGHMGGTHPRPYFLTTVGMAQKVINIYVKYATCWATAGQYAGGALAAPVDPLGIRNFICAPHCPLDRILINALLKTPVGEFLKGRELLEHGKIRQANGQWKPWSKLDCPVAYYALQWFIRRIAMSTWPKGCLNDCWGFKPANLIEEIFGKNNQGAVANWWPALEQCGENIFLQSAARVNARQRQLTGNVAAQLAQDVVAHNDPPIGSPKIIITEATGANYWPLRHQETSHTRKNHWGCLDFNGTLHLKEAARTHLGLAALLQNPWQRSGHNAYWGKQLFPSVDAALRFLAANFVIQAHEEETQYELNERGVYWVPTMP
jgi:hypothetical protein